MAKKIKMTKKQYRKLSKSWLGIIIILGVLGFNLYQEYKPLLSSGRFEVTLNQCVDGDTAWFDIDGKRTKVRFLYIDTPESTNQIEAYGKEASDYTKEQLSNADKNELELNNEGDKVDKYNRMLAWVFVDGELLQEKLARMGLVEKFYDYGYTYKYKKEIISADNYAKNSHLGIYSGR